MKGRTSQRRGLTLVEVLISLWLMLLVIGFSAGVLHRVNRQTRFQEEQTRAAYLAQQKMEEFCAQPASVIEAGQGSFSEPFHDYTWVLTVDSFEHNHVELLVLKVEVAGPGGGKYQLSSHRRGRANQLMFASHGGSNLRSRLFRVYEDGTELEQINSGAAEAGDFWPTLSPQGDRVAFVSDRSGTRQLYLMPILGSSAPSPLTEHPTGVQEPAWSPDGKHIAYVAFSEGFSQIFMLDLEDGTERRISLPGQHEGSPAWSPRGELLAFVTTDSKSGGTQIATMDPSGGRRQMHTRDEGWNTAPNFSPDGDSLAFMSNRDGTSDIYLLDLRTGAIDRVTETDHHTSSPRFSPDGKRLLVTSDVRGPRELFVVEIETGQMRQILEKDEVPALDFVEHQGCWVWRSSPSP